MARRKTKRPDLLKALQGEANKRQVGGSHYKTNGKGEEHWDRVARLGLNYWEACTTKYVERARLKGGIQDLKKARHFLDKLIELAEARRIKGYRLTRSR